MNLSIGIVGLPNVGKSTLFNAITKKSVAAENYPFCTIDPSVGVVAVPDIRLDILSKISNSKKIISAIVEFVDIAGLVKGASEGEGLGNQFLQHIREVSAIAQVVRIYEDNNLIHVHGKVNPMSDIEVINLELVLADMQVVSKRLETIERDVKRGDKDAVFLKDVLTRVLTTLESGKFANKTVLENDEIISLKSLQLITMKPMMYVLNRKSAGKNIEKGDERFDTLMNYFENEKCVYTYVDARIEEDLKDFEGEEKEMFKNELGHDNDGVADLIKSGYKLLDVISYLTTGEMETRAWTVKRGVTAPVASQAIHTDFKDKFIRAEVVSFDDISNTGSFVIAKEKGYVRTEGKEYIVKDGDVIEFKLG